MIDPDTRNAIVKLHDEGVSLREISRLLNISRNSVRVIVKQQGVLPTAARKDKIQLDPELLGRLYRECDGWMQRIHEKLVEEHQVQVSYSTLTRALRELDLGRSRKVRCDRVPDQPGEEMQHDTTEYYLKLPGRRTRVIASLIYLRYSKRRYLKFYRAFNRFAMKCFVHEALMFWGYSARQCIIDNTNLARLRGSGKRAVIVPEMVSFSGRYGFQFVCHEIKHSNRKAGNERSFWTVETNFLKGRTFETMDDLNAQALEWATVRMHHRPASKTGLISAKAFEHERCYLTRLSRHLPAPYCSYERGTDQYGYISFGANHYWVPGSKREEVKLLEYADRLKIFQHRTCVAEYPLPTEGVKNQWISPEGQPQPRHFPKSRRQGSEQEEKRLRAMGAEVEAYLDYAIKTSSVQRHRFVRGLFGLSRQVTLAVLIETLERALRYRVVHLETLHRIAWFCISQGEIERSQANVDIDVDENLRQRPAYQEGYLTDEPDLSDYDWVPSEDDGSNSPETKEES